MDSEVFFPQLASGFTAKCQRCGEDAHTLTSWIDWDERVFACLYQCIRCGAVDWFAYQGEQEVTPDKDSHNGYL